MCKCEMSDVLRHVRRPHSHASLFRISQFVSIGILYGRSLQKLLGGLSPSPLFLGLDIKYDNLRLVRWN